LNTLDYQPEASERIDRIHSNQRGRNSARF
jgi:hypothetical protein